MDKSISLYNRFSQPEQLSFSILEFLKGRISALLSERGFAYDIVDSVMAVDSATVPDTVKRAHNLSLFRKRSDFDMIYPAFNRVIRILPKESSIAENKINEQLLQEQSEKSLYEHTCRIEADIEKAAANAEYDVVLDKLAGLRTVIDSFFDDVLVMAEQDDLRRNRLALLQRISSMFSLIADFSKLVE